MSNGNMFEYNPLISVIVPVYDVDPKILHACIDSVLNQTYPNWQLCMTDDHSPMKEMAEILHTYDNDPRFRICYRTENGHIARATNDAIAMAEGEFISFLDCDDVLCPNAIEEMVRELNRNRELDFLYSDEDKLTEDGREYCYPFYKPDWSPDYMMNIMYTCHFSMYRRSIVEKIGGIPYGVDGAQDYAFTLRFTEETTNDRIAHVPKILYHWRLRVGSIAENPEAKEYAQKGVVKAKTDALARRGLKGELEWIGDNYQYRVNYICDPWPKVSVLILSKDNPAVLGRCLASIREKTDYDNYEIIVVDNGSSEANKARCEELCKKWNAVYDHHPMKFNFSALCNYAVTKATGSYYLFLNDDTEVKNSVWLKRMAGQASLPHAGAVGAKLLYPDSNRIQHVGIVSLESGPGHAYGGRDDSQVFDYGINRSDYNVLAVTGACLMVSADKFKEVGGFDEAYPETYNDVDLCMKLAEAGYYNCVRNDAVLVHYESVSRGGDLLSDAKKYSMQQAWFRLYAAHPEYCGHDPYYNPHYNQISADYAITEASMRSIKAGSPAGETFDEPALSGIDLEGMDCLANKNLLFSLDQKPGGIGIIQKHEHLFLGGWMYLFDEDPWNKHFIAGKNKFGRHLTGDQDKYIVLLRDGAPCKAVPVKAQLRPDLTRILGFACGKPGFTIEMPTEGLPSGEYGIALGVMKNGTLHYATTGTGFYKYDGTVSFLEEETVPEEPQISIAVCCHKPSYVPDNKYLNPVQVGAAIAAKRLPGMQPDDEGENISAKNRNYCELTAHYWMWKNKKADYYGLFHYRRYLSFAGIQYPTDDEGSISEYSCDADTMARYHINETDMRRVITKYDIIVPEAYSVRNGDANTARELFTINHNAVDLDNMIAVIRDKYPEYSATVDEYMAGNLNYACNMFIMTAEKFNEYSEFLFGVMDALEPMTDLSGYSAYNARLYGFLSERLLSIYVMQQMKEEGVRIRTLQRVQFDYTDAPKPETKPTGAVPVVFAVNDAYASYAENALHTLLKNKAKDTAYDILILHRGMAASHIAELQTVFRTAAAEGSTLRFVDYRYEETRLARNAGLPEITEKNAVLYLSQLLPLYDRVIALDADLLVNADLKELYESDLGDAMIGGVRNVDVITVHNRYNEPLLNMWKGFAGGRDLNSWVQPGVLVLELNLLRGAAKAGEIRDLATRFPEGQGREAINLIGTSMPAALPWKWNVQQADNDCVLVGPRAGAVAALTAADQGDYRKAEGAPAIYHYAGAVKPWNDPEKEGASLWWGSARELPCYEKLLKQLLNAGNAGSNPVEAAVSKAKAVVKKYPVKPAGNPNRAMVTAAKKAVRKVQSRLSPETQKQLKRKMKEVLPQSVIDKLKKLR